MEKNIKIAFEELGAVFKNSTTNSMVDFFDAIELTIPLYQKYWEDNLFGLDEFLEKNIEPTYENIIGYFFSDNTPLCGYTLFVNRLFRPLTPNSSEYDEWYSMFKDDEDVDLTVVRKVMEDGNLEFLQVFKSYGFPDYFFISLNDPNPENPTLFSTDHETFFSEIENEGDVASFLETFFRKDEFYRVVIKYIKNEESIDEI